MMFLSVLSDRRFLWDKGVSALKPLTKKEIAE
jgi:hypothetical protein